MAVEARARRRLRDDTPRTAADGVAAFMVTLAMTFGLILPRMLVGHVLRGRGS